ncbi:hypothetical protein [Massilia glaciei]|uniref:Uncharacterized protein n=1 Tax=Massilia glaciei TaxID=1524097 RepID=A0A2U2HHP5_9BURK|nr:hypothetical protein [Massilia glaciei]PWF45422.1 hypothetical protein C7C56_017590 [Massilia glaciei]
MAKAVADGDSHLRDEGPSNALFYVLRGLGILLAAGIFLLILADSFGDPEADKLWSNKDIIAGFALFIGAIAYLALVVRRRMVLNKAFNFPPGQYLFAFTMIDARKARLEVVDLTEARAIQATEHTMNGAYSHTTFEFSFHDARPRVWKIANRGRAEQFGAKLSALQQAVRDADARNDLATLMRLDPFIEIRRQDWALPDNSPAPQRGRVRDLLAHPLLAHPLVANPLVAALALTLVLAPSLWVARNAAADFAVRAEAKRLNTESAYTAYIRNGWFHVREMRAAVPRVALAEVIGRNSVAELRALLRRYPDDGLQADAGKAIHVLYANALAKFTAQATTSDPVLLASMEKLLRVLEQSGDPLVAIHFTRPGGEQLAELDASIKESEKEVGRKIIPASVHFGNDSAAPREARIAQGLQAAFRTIFPNDVLNLAVTAKSDTHLPRLNIRYQIAPSGAVYFSEKSNDRAFVGLVARFQSALEVGDTVDPWRFDMQVVPPDNFTVNYQMPNGAVNSGPADSLVYSVMAERAFDALAVQIRAAFFRPDSAAFKR